MESESGQGLGRESKANERKVRGRKKTVERRLKGKNS